MSTSTAGRATGCAQHPERAPLGRCASCRRAVCGECHVRLDGILHCRECLRAREEELRGRRGTWPGRAATLVLALVVLAPALLTALGLLRTVGFAIGRLTRLGAVAFEQAAGDDGR